MYKFILNCWKLNKISEDDIRAFIDKGFITEAEAEEILAIEK